MHRVNDRVSSSEIPVLANLPTLFLCAMSKAIISGSLSFGCRLWGLRGIQVLEQVTDFLMGCGPSYGGIHVEQMKRRSDDIVLIRPTYCRTAEHRV